MSSERTYDTKRNSDLWVEKSVLDPFSYAGGPVKIPVVQENGSESGCVRRNINPLIHCIRGRKSL